MNQNNENKDDEHHKNNNDTAGILKKTETDNGLIKSLNDCIDSKDLDFLNADKVTRFYNAPCNRFETDEDVLHYRGYELIEKFAKGNFSTVYTAIHLKTKIKVACKMVHLNKQDDKAEWDQSKIEDMKNELVILKKVHNPYIVKLYSHFVANKVLYIFIKYANHGTMTKHIEHKGPLNEQTSKTFFSQMLVGMEHMHSLNIAHRDIKTDNILLQLHPNKMITILITDFGLSRLIHVDPDGRVELSRTKCGTLLYMPPEILHQKPFNAFLVDIWCLGVILFFMLNKKLPYNHKNKKNQLDQQNKKEWKMNRKIVDQQPSNGLVEILDSMFEPNFERRPTIFNLIEHQWISAEVSHAKNLFHKNKLNEDK